MGVFILCPRCFHNPDLHAVYFPRCDVWYHRRLEEHGVVFGTRSGVWLRLLNEYKRVWAT
ncbi:MAG: hypothetical protein ACM4D3_02530 [Candidatus Sericytochromatia bacterium]